MSTSPVFEWLCAEIGNRTGFDALKSRGTVRLALHAVGLEPRTLTQDQAQQVIIRVLPGELKLRGVADADNRCAHIAAALRIMRFTQAVPESADSAFARLGRK